MLAIISIFGVFIIRVGGKYYIVDVFPWSGYSNKERRQLEKQFGSDWWRFARVIADKKETLEQREITALFQRCLRIITGVGWREVIVSQLSSCGGLWFNRPRNHILYNFTGWSQASDLMAEHDGNVRDILREAVESVFDPDAQTAYGCLPQSLLMGSLLTRIWKDFRETVAIQLAGDIAPEFPAVGTNSLIVEFENIMNELLSRAANQ